MSFSNIKAMSMTFAIPQYPTWIFPVLFHNFDLAIDQRHVIPAPYEALTQAVNGQMFDCFVDQDVISAPSDLYHFLTFENKNINDQSDFYVHTDADITKKRKYILCYYFIYRDKRDQNIIFQQIARTNIQVILHGNLVRGINETMHIFDRQQQNNFRYFIGTRAYPDHVQVGLSPITHYLCDAIVRIMFDDNHDPQLLSLEVIGEMGGSMIRNE